MLNVIHYQGSAFGVKLIRLKIGIGEKCEANKNAIHFWRDYGKIWSPWKTDCQFIIT